MRSAARIGVCAMTLLWAFGTVALADEASGDLRRDFVESPFSCHSRPLWFWNVPLSKNNTQAVLEGCKSSGYCGVAILPSNGMTPGFMTPEFLDRYQEAVDAAASLGMKCCLYDEFHYPSGSAGGLLQAKHPEALSKRLDMLAFDATGPTSVVRDVPSGVFMGAVAMQPGGADRRNISGFVKDGKLTWDAPKGNWKIMFFTCVRDGARGLVDYLDPEAVKRFVELTYQKYYDKFPEHFGKTIDSAFYDEPTFHWVQGGRAWTPAFNEKFKSKYGVDPVIDYPALWFDIGPETAAARNALFGFRAELYATGFPKVLNEWCAAHKIRLTGHVDQEEIVNPVGLCGDLIKAFQYQDMPGIDQIGGYGRASKAYKVVSSAANNYDRPLVVTECYGAMNLAVPNLYREAMDQFAKGINFMVPHAVWYNSNKVDCPPELSYRTRQYAEHLPDYNRYIGRLQRMLQGGRHVADIAVLYPIATLQAGYYFGPGKPYEGGVIPPEADYMDVGERLSLEVRRDFTFLHPEILAERCTIKDAALLLNNKVNAERYQVVVIPGSRTISAATLNKIKAFYDQGGRVVATTRLPDIASEPGRSDEVRGMIAAMFDSSRKNPANADPGYRVKTNAAGGRAYFTPTPSAASLKAVLDDALPVADVRLTTDAKIAGGNLSYIHKVVDGRNVYFFANSSDTPVSTAVQLRGALKLECWNPHNGKVSPVECLVAVENGSSVTKASLVLPPIHSVFWVETKSKSRTF